MLVTTEGNAQVSLESRETRPLTTGADRPGGHRAMHPPGPDHQGPLERSSGKTERLGLRLMSSPQTGG